MTEQEKMFDDAREMFLTDGWKNFIEDLQRNADAITVESLEDDKAFWIAKGQLSVLRSILGYENMMEAAEEQMEEDYAADL